MPDLKISQLAAGNPAQSGDLIPIDRAGANFSISIAGVVGGSNTQIQFNDSSKFGGDSKFTWDKTTKRAVIGGPTSLIDPDWGVVLNASLYVVSIGSLTYPEGNAVFIGQDDGVNGAPIALKANTIITTSGSGGIGAQLGVQSVANSSNVNELVGATADAQHDSSGHALALIGLRLLGNGNNNGGTVDENVGLQILNCSGQGTNNYAIHILNQTTGTAIKIDGGINNLGPGATTIGSIVLTGLVSNYNNITTVANGVPSEYAQVNTTAQSADIGATTLYAVPASGAGLYRVSAYIQVTQAATTSSTLPAVQITFTDQDNTATTMTLNATSANTSNALTTFEQAVATLNVKASTNIQYKTSGYASVGGTAMNFKLKLRLEAI